MKLFIAMSFGSDQQTVITLRCQVSIECWLNV